MSTVADDPMQALLQKLARESEEMDAQFAAEQRDQQAQISAARKGLLESTAYTGQKMPPELVELSKTLQANAWLIPAVQAFVAKSLKRQAELQAQIVGENQ